MTWLAYRQFRLAAIAGTLAVAVLVLLLALTPSTQFASCAGQSGCPDVHSFLHMHHEHLVRIFGTLLVGLPALVGAFWGAPLVAREIESGTYRLAWTQSITRTRWLAIKLAVVALAGAALCGLWSLLLGLWSSNAVEDGRLQPANFAQRGIVPIGYAVFALALGVALGLVIRRAIPAMAATLVGFTAVRMLVQYLARPHLVPSKHAALPVTTGIGIQLKNATVTLLPPPVKLGHSWVESTRLVDNAGHAPSSQFIHSACASALVPPKLPPGGGAKAFAPVSRQAMRGLQDCVAHVATRFHVAATYQPMSHYWALQGAETAVFVALAGLLTAFSFWWVRHRLA